VFAPLQDASAHSPGLGFAMFGIYAFTMSLGPGSVAGSGLLGVELSPTRIRSIAQAVTVLGGRIGASIAAFVFPVLLDHMSPVTMIMGLGATSIAGAIATLALLPETKGRSLEEINHDTDAAIAPAVAVDGPVIPS